MFEGDSKIKDFLNNMRSESPVSPDVDWKKWGLLVGVPLTVLALFLGIGFFWCWKAVAILGMISAGGVSVFVAVKFLPANHKLEIPAFGVGIVLAASGLLWTAICLVAHRDEPERNQASYQAAYSPAAEAERTAAKQTDETTMKAAAKAVVPEEPVKQESPTSSQVVASDPIYSDFEKIPWPSKYGVKYLARTCVHASDPNLFWVVIIPEAGSSCLPTAFRVVKTLGKRVEEWLQHVTIPENGYYAYEDIISDYVPRGTITVIDSKFWEGRAVSEGHKWWYPVDMILESGKVQRILASREFVEALGDCRALPLPKPHPEKPRVLSEADIVKLDGWILGRRSTRNDCFLFVPADGSAPFRFVSNTLMVPNSKFYGPSGDPIIWTDFGRRPEGVVVDRLGLESAKNGCGGDYYFITLEHAGVRRRYRTDKQCFLKAAPAPKPEEEKVAPKSLPKHHDKESDF